ncbi:MAG: peptidylprolyl isomerase [Nitrospirae bacterium YQR-1]
MSKSCTLLKRLHKRRLDIILRTGIIAIFLVLILSTAVSAAPVVLDRVVAVIDKDVITWSELYKMMEFEMSDKLKGLKQKEKLEILKRNEQPALEKFIEMRLIVSEAKRRGIVVLPKELDAAVDEISSKYKLTKNEFVALLRQEGFTLEEYKKSLADQIMIQKVTAAEVFGKLMVTDEEIKERTKGLNVGSDAGRYRIRVILRLYKKDAQENMKAEQLMADIYAKLVKGADFGNLAAQYSEGPNVLNGGDLGFVNKDEMEKDLADIVVTMKEGEFSKVIHSRADFKIVQLVEKQLAETPEKYKESVRNEILDEKTKKAFKDLIKSLKDKRVIKILL